MGLSNMARNMIQAVQAQAHDCGEIIWVGMLEKNSQGLQKHGRSGDENHTGIKKAPILRLGLNIGAGTKSRTRDLLITSQLLYQLSYTGWVLLCYCFLYPLRSGGFLLVPAPRVELGTF